MQEETVEDVFSDVLTDEVKEKSIEHEESIDTEKPIIAGYMSKEAWIESGKDAKDWQSPELFAESVKRVKETSRLKRELADARKEFDSRLKDSNLLWQGQLSRQRAELMERRDDAVGVADLSTVKKLDKQIADLDNEAELVKESPKQSIDQPPEIAEWEEENPWVNDVSDPRVPVAQKAFKESIDAGKTYAYALRQADKAVSALKPQSKQEQEIRKKPAVSMSDSSRAATTSGDSVTLSWNQLSGEEKTLHEELFSHKTQKEYLKIVADARTGVKK